MRNCSSMEFKTTIRLPKLSGFGKPRVLCVNPGYLSKPYKNFGFGFVRYIYIYISLSLSVCLSICLSICLCLYPSISLFVLVSNYLSMCPCIYLSVLPSISLAVPLTIYLSVRLSIYLFIYLSVCPSIYVSIYVSIHVSTYLCVYLSVYLSMDLSIYLSIYRSIYLSLSLSIYLSVYLSIYLYVSIYLSMYRSMHLSMYLSIFLSFYLSLYLTFSTSEPPKMVRTSSVLDILTWKCASRHNGVHFFDIATSKSGPNPWCFVHFDLEMCFAPQRRALFRHRNFQKWSEPLVFCTFWLGNVLRATTACTFSTSQLPKVVRTPGVLYILTSKCASRHNGVQFFISHLASWLRTRRFSEPTFRASGATNHWKNTVFRDFPTFSRICIFFLLTLSLLWSSLF